MILDELTVTQVGEYLWRLQDDLSWSDGCNIITVPAGYVTDFASVPRALWAMFPPYGKYTKAAVVHDWLYSQGIGTKADADKIFYRIMLELGVAKWRAKMMYAAVKYGGKGNFK